MKVTRWQLYSPPPQAPPPPIKALPLMDTMLAEAQHYRGAGSRGILPGLGQSAFRVVIRAAPPPVPCPAAPKRYNRAPCACCIGFVRDWLTVVMTSETDSLAATGIKAKRLSRILDPLAQELTRFFARLEKTEIYCVESYLALVRTASKGSAAVQVPVDQMIKALRTYCKQSSLSEFHPLFQDTGVCRTTEQIDSFVAECLMMLWGQLPAIHQEHTKQTPPSQTGPSLGLRSHIVYNRPIAVSKPTSIAPQESLASRLADFEEDDLYR